VATFADSGTMTADFTRWARSGREAVLAALTAFPIANLTAQIFGILVVAAGAAAAPATNGGNFMPILVSHGALLADISLVFVFVNLGSVCTHCLYNGAVGYSHLFGSKMRILTVVLGIIGGLLAVAGVWSFFLSWLNLLGIFVPPIGAIMIVDQLLLGQASQGRPFETVRAPAFMAWAAGALAAIAVHVWSPEIGEAVTGMIVGAAAYGVLNGIRQPNARLQKEAGL
jgi:cytosine permease